jgi:esterase/lipase superfamily enzyme
MPTYWMISDRSLDGPAQLFGSDQADLTYWFSDVGPLDNQASWTRSNATDFEAALRSAVAAFPPIIDPAHQQDQKHIAFFVHGYNNTWQDEAKRYQSICDALFSGPDSLGLCIWFDWPSKGSALGYLPDRGEATSCAADFCDVLDSFYEWLLDMEKSSAADPTNPNAVCRAKLSVIAHSMGNFLLQKAMYQLWTRKNRPLLVSLINQC